MSYDQSAAHDNSATCYRSQQCTQQRRRRNFKQVGVVFCGRGFGRLI